MELVGIIKEGGPMVLAAVLAWLYLEEKKDRRQLQARLDQVTERSIIAMESAKGSIAALSTILTGKGGS